MDEAARSSQEKQPDAVTNPCAEPRPKQERQAAPAATPRKRLIDDSDVEPQSKRARTTRPTSEPARLTRQNLARFNKMGKKKTSDPTDDSGSTKTKTTSTTSSGFAVKARKNGILDPHSSKPPKDLDDLQKQHAKSRATASPPESEYERYTDKVGQAGNEATVVVKTSQLLKEYPKGYSQAYNRAFTNLPRDVGFNNDMSAPQPDFVEGPEMESYLPFPVDDQISGATLYKDDPRSITLPQIAGEWKGPSGDMKEATRQAAYDGAAMVYARAQALAYMGEEDPLGHVVATTFTTDGTNLNMYAHYAAPAEDDEDILEYHQYPISSTNLISSYEDFKKGRKQLRNAQDHAKAQSEQLRDQLKQHWKKSRTKLPPVAKGVHPPDVEPPPHATDGYEDASPHVLQEEEDEEDYEIVQPTHHSKSSHRRHSSSQHFSKSHHSSHHSSPHSSKSHHSSSKTSHRESSHPHSESHKRKTSQISSYGSSHGSSRHESKRKDYWKKNANGYYYHRHSDGTITWYDDVEQEQ